ncbi:MAG: signal recognition particle subunit SRP19/SEC65 family protein [Thermoproteus sp.]|jgi:signal recognition particle subunit SRP19
MKGKGGRILWLVYIDATVPRSLGRILPRRLAVPKPSVEEVARALDRLGIRYEAHGDKRYPALWYDERGRGYFVIYTEDVRDAARKIAEEISRSRG